MRSRFTNERCLPFFRRFSRNPCGNLRLHVAKACSKLFSHAGAGFPRRHAGRLPVYQAALSAVVLAPERVRTSSSRHLHVSIDELARSYIAPERAALFCGYPGNMTRCRRTPKTYAELLNSSSAVEKGTDMNSPVHKRLKAY